MATSVPCPRDGSAIRRVIGVTDCTERHPAAPNDDLAGEGQEGTPKETLP
jgi:hypothetical protein